MSQPQPYRPAQPGETVRLRGPADYRGWALKIDTIDPATEAAIKTLHPGPHYAKRWTLGHDFLVCLGALLAYHLLGRAPETLQGERVLKMRLVHIDPDHPQPDPPL